FIIHEADRMLPYSSNALLKTFEEPPLDSVIILLTNALETILPTIRSRCRLVNFQTDKNEQESLTCKPVHQLLLQALAKGGKINYLEIKQLAQELEMLLEKEKELFEVTAK